MVSRRKKRQMMRTIIVLVLAVAALVMLTLAVTTYVQSRSARDIRTTEVKASVGSNSVKAAPYRYQELGTDAVETTPTDIAVGADDELEIEVPRSLCKQDRGVVAIYDDPAANDGWAYTSNQDCSVKIPGSVEVPPVKGAPKPAAVARLVVVELSGVYATKDANGEETAASVTWSFHNPLADTTKKNKN